MSDKAKAGAIAFGIVGGLAGSLTILAITLAIDRGRDSTPHAAGRAVAAAPSVPVAAAPAPTVAEARPDTSVKQTPAVAPVPPVPPANQEPTPRPVPAPAASEPDKAAPPKPTERERPVAEMRADELVSAFQGNAARVQQTYGGKWITLKGTVHSVELVEGHSCVRMVDPSYQSGDIMLASLFVFPNSDGDAAALNPGQTISATGKLGIGSAVLVLKYCKLR